MSTLAGFGGAATLERSDVARLSSQLHAVRSIMSDGRYRTLEEIAQLVTQITGKKATEPSVSARLRDLRKDKFGSLIVERRLVAPGLFQYRVIEAAAKEDVEKFEKTFNVNGTTSRRLKSTTEPSKPAKPVAGSRAANAYVEELKNGGK